MTRKERATVQGFINRKWYIEFVAYGVAGYMGGIEADSGNAAIEYLKAHVVGVSRIIGVWHDD